MLDNNTFVNGDVTPNQVWYQLTPTTSILDAANGIMDIDSSVSGAANGVGIQIAYGTASTPVMIMIGSGKGNLLDLPTPGGTAVVAEKMGQSVVLLPVSGHDPQSYLHDKRH